MISHAASGQYLRTPKGIEDSTDFRGHVGVSRFSSLKATKSRAIRNSGWPLALLQASADILWDSQMEEEC